MIFNKWTLGLAAVGTVSMASAVQGRQVQLQTVDPTEPITCAHCGCVMRYGPAKHARSGAVIERIICNCYPESA